MSARANESAFLYGTFARHFGTNNLPDCSNMCHESSGSALTESIGIGKGTCTIEGYENAEVILMVGHNPATIQPRMRSTLSIAKDNGAKIISMHTSSSAHRPVEAHAGHRWTAHTGAGHLAAPLLWLSFPQGVCVSFPYSKSRYLDRSAERAVERPAVPPSLNIQPACTRFSSSRSSAPAPSSA